MKLINAEWKKVFTTNTWWIFGLILIPLWGFTLFINYFQTQFLADPASLDIPADDPSFSDPSVIAQRLPENIAANLYTNGQLTALAIIMVLGIIIMTSEFFHQTVTTTFLTTPHRSAVIAAKFAVAGLLGIGFWALTTAANLLVAPIILNSFDTPTMLSSGAIKTEPPPRATTGVPPVSRRSVAAHAAVWASGDTGTSFTLSAVTGSLRDTA